MKRTLLLLACTALFLPQRAQTFNSPESVEFDPAGNRYIVSNTSAGNLQSVVPGNAPTLFTAQVSAPYGLAAYNGNIYVCDDGAVKGYSLTNAQETFNLDLGGSFLNGICSDGAGKLYVTDFGAKKIYAVNIAGNSFTEAVANTGSTPNGILFDAAHRRLIFCTWGSSAKLIEVDTSDFSMQTKITTTLSNFDGVVTDRCGNFLVSEWGTDKIYKIDSLFGAPTAVFSAGINSPADIYFNLTNDTLAVPNAGANTVTFHGADFCTEDTVDNSSISENEINRFEAFITQDEMTLLWKLDDYSHAIYISVVDMTGKSVLTKNITGQPLQENTSRISTRHWPAGIYVVSLQQGDRHMSRKVFVGRQ